MNKVIILPHFKKSLKPLVRKFPSLKETVVVFLETFDEKKCIKLQEELYKARLRTSDLSRGKNKSFRIIIQVIKSRELIVPIKIYFKSQKQNITLKEVNKDLEIILLELKESY
jgi:mRNA-degrading endonuclease RelE of RelBE toxin-antitoxin system